MKKILIFCLPAFCSFILSAQDMGGEYLFHRFEYARIFYKNGAIAKADVNYDLTVNKFVYIDTADSLIKEIGEIEKIGAIDNDLLGHTGRMYERKDQERWAISGFERFYQVERGNKMRYFSTIKQFLKIYPRGNRDAIETFIEKNHIRLESPEQVAELCKFAASLGKKEE